MTRRLFQDLAEPSAPTLPRLGDVLVEKYRVERVLGSGGMGVVFEVTHVVMVERRFAVKWLVSASEDRDALRRFVREARIAGKIRHPHVVDVFDIYLEPTGCFLVMELLDGESLAARLAREGALSVADVCRVFLPCLSGMSAAHAAGVVHRDLKPENVFLCRTKEAHTSHPKVLDFGISRFVAVHADPGQTTTRPGIVSGTPPYMAPEQLRAAEADFRTDVYAAGVMLYEALSGQHPFEATSFADLTAKIMTGNAPPLSSRTAQVSQALSDVVARAMHPDPARRFQTIDALAEALERFQHHGASPIDVRNGKATRRSLLNRARLVLGAALAAIALVIAGVQAFKESRAASAARSQLPMAVHSSVPTSDTPRPQAGPPAGPRLVLDGVDAPHSTSVDKEVESPDAASTAAMSPDATVRSAHKRRRASSTSKLPSSPTTAEVKPTRSVAPLPLRDVARPRGARSEKPVVDLLDL